MERTDHATNSAQFSQFRSHCSYHTVQINLSRSYGSDHTVQIILFRSHCSNHTVQIIGFRAYCSEHTVQNPLFRSHCSDHTVQITLFRSHCSNHTVQIIMFRSNCYITLFRSYGYITLFRSYCSGCYLFLCELLKVASFWILIILVCSGILILLGCLSALLHILIYIFSFFFHTFGVHSISRPSCLHQKSFDNLMAFMESSMTYIILASMCR